MCQLKFLDIYIVDSGDKESIILVQDADVLNPSISGGYNYGTH